MVKYNSEKPSATVKVLLPHPRAHSEWQLRTARVDDAFLIWLWRDDATSDKNNVEPRPLAWSPHLQALEEELGSPAKRIWIAESNGVPAGQIRYERIDTMTAEVVVFTMSRFRRRGLALWLLDATANRAAYELGITTVQATIAAGDEAGQRLLLRARFVRCGEKEVNGRACWLFRRRCAGDMREESVREG